MADGTDPLSFLTSPLTLGAGISSGSQVALFSPPDVTSGDSSSTGIYTPNAPNLLGAFNTGFGMMQRMLDSYHKVDPSLTPRSSLTQSQTPQEPVTTTPQATPPVMPPVTSPTPTEDYTRMVGNGTTFGLDYVTGNADATDTNPTSAFGFNVHDKNLEGASLPISVINASIGDYAKDSSTMDAIKRGDYKLAVTNQAGVTRTVPIVDAGPGESTGNAIDLTYKTSHDLATQGKAKLGFQLIGPDGEVMPIKGYHPHTVSDTNWDHHFYETEIKSEQAREGGGYASTERGIPAGWQPTGNEPEITNQAREGAFTSYSGNEPRRIQGIILHSSDGNEKGDINTLTGGDPNHKVSAHYYTTQDGRSLHFVNDNDIAFHAGATTGKYGYLNNSNTIGIEQEHIDGQPWKDEEVRGTAKTVAQLLTRYPYLTLDDVLGHSDIAPERKEDPLNFPWDNFKKYVQEAMGEQGAKETQVAQQTQPGVPAKEEETKGAETKPAETKPAEPKQTERLRALQAVLGGYKAPKFQPLKEQKEVVLTPKERPQFPTAKLAEGGIVTEPTIALVGEKGPEAIVPLATAEERSQSRANEKRDAKATPAFDDPAQPNVFQWSPYSPYDIKNPQYKPPVVAPSQVEPTTQIGGTTPFVWTPLSQPPPRTPSQVEPTSPIGGNPSLPGIGPAPELGSSAGAAVDLWMLNKPPLESEQRAIIAPRPSDKDRALEEDYLRMLLNREKPAKI